MIKKCIVLFLSFALLLGVFFILNVDAANRPLAKISGNSNPLMDHKLGADPYSLVYNERVYIYMSSDTYVYNNDGSIKDNDFSALGRIQVISSADMVNWTDHGAIPVAGANNKNSGRGIAKWASNSWAPAIAHKKINGKDKFFLYFANGGAGIGVLTADTPIGPWTDPLGKALVTHSTPGMAGVTWLFDPAVLVDDDGTGYLYSGGGIPNESDPASIAHPKTARVSKLGTDMISVVGSATTINAPYLFEDSGIHMYNDKYYYSYCINFAGTHPTQYPAGEIGYMVSDNPMGPFTYKGHFLKNPHTFFGVGGNNHHAVFNFKNEWYVVYHAQTVSKAQIGTGKGYRSPHINKLVYNTDGSIQEVQGNMTGVAQLSNLNPYTRVEAETIAWQAGITTEPTQATGGPVSNLDVTNIHNGDWVAVGKADFGSTGAKTFKANVATNVGGNIEVRLDSETGPLVGSLKVPSTGGMQIWREVETTINNATGVRNIYLVFTGAGNGNLFNLDAWQFTPNTGGNMETKVEAENMNIGGTYVGKISTPFDGVALYGTDDYASYSQYFANPTHNISVRGASSNARTAKVDLVIGGATVGSFYFTSKTPTVQSLSNITHATGDQEVKLTLTSDDGTWDAYVDFIEFSL